MISHLPSDVLLRKIPEELIGWIQTERKKREMSQREFLVSLLDGARQSEEAKQFPLLFEHVEVEKPVPSYRLFNFIDLFAGIGGFRIALESLGGDCVFTSEWDTYSRKTYKEWFSEDSFGDDVPEDINELDPSDIPDCDVLAAGFPCQPFSIAGVSKKKSLGREHGFNCIEQGNLFFKLAEIIEVKRPPVLILENVKNLRSHDKGRTWDVIESTLNETLNYRVFFKVIDAAGWVPQHRERVYIVCFDREVFGNDPPFSFPESPDADFVVKDILEPNPDPKYTLSDKLWGYLQAYAEKHKAKGNGFGYGLADLDGITRTLSARYFKDGSEILIPQKRKNPRRLTPTECARLMGFDDDDREYKLVVSDTQAYRQFGNAVVPNVVRAIGENVMKVIAKQMRRRSNGCLLKRTKSRRKVRLKSA